MAEIIKCPYCETLLAANETYFGCKVSCDYCDTRFILEKEYIAKPVSEDTSTDTVQNNIDRQISSNFTDSEVLSISLNDRLPKLSYTTPLNLRIGERKLTVSSWTAVYLAVCKWLYEHRKTEFLSLCEHNFPSGSRRVCVTREKNILCRAALVSDNIWVETNYSSEHIFRMSAKLAEACNADKSLFLIGYTKSNRRKKRRNAESSASKTRFEFKDNFSAAPEYSDTQLQLRKDRLIRDIQVYYPNGFDFSANALRLVEQRLGEEIEENLLQKLKNTMFKRHDGFYFFPEEILTHDDQQGMRVSPLI